MKKLFTTLLVCCFVFFTITFIGCGDDSNTSTDYSAENDYDTTTDYDTTSTDDTDEAARELENKKALERSLDLFAGNVVRESRTFLEDTPLVKLFPAETITLKVIMHLKMSDSYDTEVTGVGQFSEGVINTSIQMIADSDPLGRKNVAMGSPIAFPLACESIDGAWKLKGDGVKELIDLLERKFDLNNESAEFEARMRSFERRIDSIANPTGSPF